MCLPPTCPLLQPKLFSHLRDQGLLSNTYVLPLFTKFKSRKGSAGQSQWSLLALHWPAQVLTLIWERGGEEFISNTKLTPFNPVVRYLKGVSFDAGKHASPAQMIPTTKSHKFSSFLPILSLLQILGACHHLGQVERKQRVLKLVGLVEIRKMSHLVIWSWSSGAAAREAQKSPQNCSCSPF